MKFAFLPSAACGVLALAASSASAKEYQVKMLNQGAAGLMAFEPAYVKIAPGDSVKFLATSRGHNAETINGMTPVGGVTFKGKFNEEIVVKFDKSGVYGYKCLPHAGMGMVGVVQVGSATNKGAVTAAAAKLTGLAKKRMLELIAKTR